MSVSDFPEMDSLCNEVLTAIEWSELKLLDWGFVDVRSPLEEMLPDLLEKLSGRGHQLWDNAQQFDVSIEDILVNLRERRLIFSSAQSELYRSRFAETIRLLTLLRQRFSYEDWQTASRLVSDAKIYLTKRKYPKRDVSQNELIDELRAYGPSSLYIEAVEALLKQGVVSLTLARFQKEAILQQYRVLHPQKGMSMHNDYGVVIGAGTGAGKTKAFYIPVMAEIAATMTLQPYVRALAIYPRVELLKDQFLEAFQEARKLDELMNRQERRAITIGAYYGDTPYEAKTFLNNSVEGWRKVNSPTKEGWESPFFSCPGHEDKGTVHSLIWYKKDVEKEVKANERGEYGQYARLRCPDCYFQTEAHQLLLTRKQMIRTPPDILFTTTEMLNRRLSHAGEHRLFGIDTNTPPKLLLLDEIHTYEGLQGTQVAYLLRRWRHARRQQRYEPLCCVGLSATLTNAEAFFARLTGITQSLVRYVRPEEQDMEQEGIEYNVVLKGDPVSGTSLLSTSVQVVMLLGRLLDKSSDNPSHGAYGQKLFAFTDKLDVINRWFHIEEDVEKKLLSQYRLMRPEDTDDIRQKKREAGQDWWLCDLIGHPLKARLKVNLTSSQHRGVDASANIIIATSTLEVGFNDPAVGAIVQHKAPRSLASFLQRKGRAGRLRSMRPWMVVVASAYGRDRWAFQHAENLFDPILNDIDLPLDNYYVRKMQATFALMDWLSFKLKQEPDCSSVNIWSVLSSNDKGQFNNAEALQKQRRKAQQKLIEVLNGTLRDDFELYLQQSLGLYERRTIHSLLWDEPRSLLFEVLPTLIRQLETNWRRLEGDKVVPWADTIAKYPMPDFVTPNLFSDLQSPEIILHLPAIPSQKSGYNSKPTMSIEREDKALPLQQCLTEFAPGNVSKRYADSRVMQDAHWLEIPDRDYSKRELLQVSNLKIEYDSGSLPFTIEGTEYQLFRPRAYTLGQVPQNVSQTSVSHMLWHSHFASKKLGSAEDASLFAEIMLPLRSQWNNIFNSIRSYTHANGSWIEIARLGTGVQADTRYTKGKKSQRLWLQFEEQGKPAGLGFINFVDALEFQFQPLDIESFVSSNSWPELYRSLGQTFFLYKLQHDPRIRQAKLSPFEIEWLWQLELSMLVATAVTTQCSLEEASRFVRIHRTSSQNNSRDSLADRTMRVIFQAQVDDLDEEKVGRLHDKLKQLLTEEPIQQALDDAQQALWDWNDAQLQKWLQQCYASSLGNTLFASLTQLVPDVDPDDLILDIIGNSIWISEITPGGIGIVSKIGDALVTKPYEFELQMLDTLQYCERQQLATQLQMVANLLGQADQNLLSTFAVIREETDLPSQKRTLEQLKDILEAHGIPATRELIVALHAKFLRPNSKLDSDSLLTTLVQFWQSEEQRLGCAIDLRVIAVAALKNAVIEQQVRAVLERIGDSSEVKENQIFNLLQSLLWLSCPDSCPDCIERLYQYQDFVKPSRAILLALLEPHAEQVTFGTVDWQEQLQQKLTTQYVVQVTCSQNELEACKQNILDMLVKPVEIGFQFFYPTVERLSRTGLLWMVELRIREFANV
ncbi:MAG TPA: protein DpdJ [Ktedonobacteraceae bacterium]|nr:protein DpdJ [Ktedonobacteraceae bacterium]